MPWLRLNRNRQHEQLVPIGADRPEACLELRSDFVAVGLPGLVDPEVAFLIDSELREYRIPDFQLN